MLRRALALVALLVFAVVAVALARALTLSSVQVEVEAVEPLAVDGEAVARRLGAAISARTISVDGGELDEAAFAELHALLEASYPRVFAQLGVERIGRWGLLLTWRGAQPDLPAVLLAAHQDVVPVAPGTEEAWEQPPFSGRLAEGYVWGRGAIDCKASLIGILEATEGLLASGFVPQRTLLLAFGQDEEIGGQAGAVQIAAKLKRAGIQLEFVLDEGLVITDGIVPGLSAPAALVGLSEKGYLSLDLVAAGEGGHSSMPPRETAVGILATGLARLQAEPFPPHMDGPSAGMFAALGPEMGFSNKLAFANLWLLGGVVRGKLAAKPGTDASIRTTTAPTMLSASSKENVLPPSATATVNFRIHPSDDIASVIERVERVLADERIRVERRPGFNSEPSPVSSTESRAWEVIGRSIREAAPEVIVAPGLVLGATDGRHYTGLADDVYRFAPSWVKPEDTARIHGTDERVSVDNLVLYVRFYDRLIRNAAS